MQFVVFLSESNVYIFRFSVFFVCLDILLLFYLFLVFPVFFSFKVPSGSGTLSECLSGYHVCLSVCHLYFRMSIRLYFFIRFSVCVSVRWFIWVPFMSPFLLLFILSLALICSTYLLPLHISSRVYLSPSFLFSSLSVFLYLSVSLYFAYSFTHIYSLFTLSLRTIMRHPFGHE